MFGSMASGLAIDSSDMDILVSGVFSKPVFYIIFFTGVMQDQHLVRHKLIE